MGGGVFWLKGSSFTWINLSHLFPPSKKKVLIMLSDLMAYSIKNKKD